MSASVLAGMDVVELSAFVAAPLGGMTLAQLGARVWRIDDLRGGLDYRRWPVTDNNVSLFWAGLNKGKFSAALDLSREEGRELAQALITAPGEDAGLMATNFPARGWLDYEALKKRRADLVQVVLMGDRHGGSAVDYTVNPATGLPLLTGESGVVNHLLPAWDLISGQMLATALLAAERHRRRCGRGQQVRLALEDVAMATLGHLGFIAEAQQGVERERSGNYLYGAFGRDFLSRDGERLMVVALTAKQWRALCDATGCGDRIEGLARQQGLDFRQEGDRYRAREVLAALFEPWFAERDFEQIRACFDERGVCWGRYQSVAGLVASDPACSLANPMFEQVWQPGIGSLLTPASPLNFSDCERVPATAAPRLGEHTERMLSERLGVTSAEYGRLLQRGLVAAPGE
ncbi:CoA transferase [Alloalcanivorax mobilis]|uniref:CoA transferase n=1 Tax=Alloalcanivorax mobilis TaxID=2019569 RepID=UPI000C75FC21|nr:CoA transferase [Alloalcanivorax mobilis]|tara:strand:- start:21332 stop:22543 length:1212 start_codon:yes stop_codon:yes gene_type:complete